MNFKRKPVIIIVVGMAGKTLWCTSSVYLKKKLCALSDLNDFMFFGTHEALIEFIYIFYYYSREWKNDISSPFGLSYKSVEYSGICTEPGPSSHDPSIWFKY